MANQRPWPPSRKSSVPSWERLKPTRQDPLEVMGFVSKGDTRLLEAKTQEFYYNKIVARYMQFCTQYSRNLSAAFASLTLRDSSPTKSPAQPAVPDNIPPVATGTDLGRPFTTPPSKRFSSSPDRTPMTVVQAPQNPSAELSTILLALRKLREALLASSSTASSPVFSQRVHVFSIRLAILALQPESYYHSLLHLLFALHTPVYPLPPSELFEMTSYLILDLACRRREFATAYELRSRSKVKHNFESRNVDAVLCAVVTGNWVAFWKVRRKVDGYLRAIMQWAVEDVRRNTLKAFGRAYMACEIKWLMYSASGGEMTWDELVMKENVGWIRNGDEITIRKPKTRTKVPVTEYKESGQ